MASHQTRPKQYQTWISRCCSWLPFLRREGPILSLHPSSDSLSSRYEPCRILTTNGITNVVWFDDVVAFYHGNRVVFDLNLLVANPRIAANILIEAGFRETRSNPIFLNDLRSCRGGIRLSKHFSKEEVVLISASEWNYDPSLTVASSSAPFPPLNSFLDSLMGRWLGMSETEYDEKHLFAMSLVGLINDCYNLKGPHVCVRSIQYAQRLLPEHRELHFDLIGDHPGKQGISTYRKHEYHVLRCEQIKNGDFTPEPYPTTGKIPPSLAAYPKLTGLQPKRRAKSRMAARPVSRLCELGVDVTDMSLDGAFAKHRRS
jgi:hypothetical protein